MSTPTVKRTFPKKATPTSDKKDQSKRSNSFRPPIQPSRYFKADMTEPEMKPRKMKTSVNLKTAKNRKTPTKLFNLEVKKKDKKGAAKKNTSEEYRQLAVSDDDSDDVIDISDMLEDNEEDDNQIPMVNLKSCKGPDKSAKKGKVEKIPDAYFNMSEDEMEESGLYEEESSDEEEQKRNVLQSKRNKKGGKKEKVPDAYFNMSEDEMIESGLHDNDSDSEEYEQPAVLNTKKKVKKSEKVPDEFFNMSEDEMEASGLYEEDSDSDEKPVLKKKSKKLEKVPDAFFNMSEDEMEESGLYRNGSDEDEDTVPAMKKKKLTKKASKRRKSAALDKEDETSNSSSAKKRKTTIVDERDSESDFEESMKGKKRKTEDVDEEEDEDKDDEEQQKAFREAMSNLPLSKVKEMKEKLGLKIFNKAYFGENKTAVHSTKVKTGREENTREKKRSQHAPKEISSKKPVSTFRNLYPNEKKKKQVVDPRFDPNVGEFKESSFHKVYDFLDDIRKGEKEELRAELSKAREEGDDNRAKKLKIAVQRIENLEKNQAERKRHEETMKELNEKNIERMLQGQAPVYKTRKELRMIHLEKKFENLKESNKLNKYLEKKAKKMSQKELKAKPEIRFEQKYGYQ